MIADSKDHREWMRLLVEFQGITLLWSRYSGGRTRFLFWVGSHQTQCHKGFPLNYARVMDGTSGSQVDGGAVLLRDAVDGAVGCSPGQGAELPEAFACRPRGGASDAPGVHVHLPPGGKDNLEPLPECAPQRRGSMRPVVFGCLAFGGQLGGC